MFYETCLKLLVNGSQILAQEITENSNSLLQIAYFYYQLWTMKELCLGWI